MKILFSATHFGFLRNFQSTIRLLAERGHELHLLAERTDAIDGRKMADLLAADHPSITFELLPSSRHRLWYSLATGVRAALDYWRYLDPRWDHSDKLRGRAAEQAPRFAVALAQMPVVGSRAGLALLRRAFRAAERVLPAPDEVTEVFRRVQPDLLMLTPLLYFRSHQVDHVRCARQLGIKTVLGVGSWDHLTTKGLIHEVPDRVLVWNEAQREEAITLHGVPSEHVLVTGAQAYDHWFAARPSADREAFCRHVGLDPGRPVLLYLCSSPFIAPYEVGFVRQWIAAIRQSADPVLRSTGVLVRPHPQNARQWEGVDLAAEFPDAAFWPKTGVNPIGGQARADYFDSMYHAEAVVGVNTSGMIESGIVGRPVYTIDAKEFASTQEGTLHFQHLKNVEGGLLHLAADLDEHLAQLTRLLSGQGDERRRARGFIQGFIRPHGLDAARGRRDRAIRRRPAECGELPVGRRTDSPRPTRPGRRGGHRGHDGASQTGLDRPALDETHPADDARARVSADLRGALPQACAGPDRAPRQDRSQAGARSAVTVAPESEQDGAPCLPDVAEGCAGPGAVVHADLPVRPAPRLIPGLRAGHS
jgi:hypothetical protein